MKVLLVFGADVNSLNSRKQTPSDVAEQVGCVVCNC